MAHPVDRPRTTEEEWPLPNIPPIITNDPDPENYQEYLIRAEAEADRQAALIDDHVRTSPSSQSAEVPVHVPVVPVPVHIVPFTFTRSSQISYYTLLVITVLSVASTVPAFVLLVIDSRRFGPRSAIVIWFTVSVTIFALSTICFRENRRLRYVRKAEWEEAQAMELAEHHHRETQRTWHEARDREIQREALERTARRSLHSAQESEHDVRILTDRSSEMGVPNPIADTDDIPSTPTHWENDLYPMTEEERNERRQVRDERLVARVLREAEHPGAPRERDGAISPAMLVSLRRIDTIANRERQYRNAENVGGWFAQHDIFGEREPRTPPPVPVSAEQHTDQTLVGTPPTPLDDRGVWARFSPARLFRVNRGDRPRSG